MVVRDTVMYEDEEQIEEVFEMSNSVPYPTQLDQEHGKVESRE